MKSEQKFKVAIVIGHAPDRKGFAPSGFLAEFDYNSAVAMELLNLNPDMYDVYFHDSYKGGYTAMQTRTTAKINKKDYLLVIELHYNCFDGKATGTEAWYYHTSKLGLKYATSLSKGISSRFTIKNRGGKPALKTNNGGQFLYLTKAPAVLIEPFFADNLSDREKFKFPKVYAFHLNEEIKTLFTVNLKNT